MKKKLLVILAVLALASVGAWYYKWNADLTLTHATTHSIGLEAVVGLVEYSYTPTPTPSTPSPTPTPIVAAHQVYFPIVSAGPRPFPILWRIKIGHIPEPPYASCAFWCYFMGWGYEGGPDYLTQEISATITGSWTRTISWVDLGLEEPEVGSCACVARWTAHKLDDPHCYEWCVNGRDSLQVEE